MQVFQYQALAQPVQVDAPVVVVALDWLVQQPANHHRLPRSATFNIHAGISWIAAEFGNTRFVTDIKIDHDETITSKQSRRHEQQVAKLLNALARKGQLRGTVPDPSLGYLAADPLDWGNDPPITLDEALDRIAIALRNLGQTP